MKKKIVFCLILIFIMVSVTSSAVNPLIYTAINDVIQLGPTPSNVPIRVGGTVYVLPETFTRLLGLKSVYNLSMDRLIIYREDINMVFDMKNGTAMDESGNPCSVAIRRNSKIYVPAKAVCDKFGFEYSYITSSSLGGIVRINDGSPAYEDSFFLEKNAETMRNLYLSYTKTYEESEVTPQPDNNEEEEETTDEPTQSKTVYISLKCTKAEEIENMLNELSLKGHKAVFFINEDIALDGDALRKIYVEGHGIGILWQQESGREGLERVNNIIKDQLMTKTNLVMFESSKELSDDLRSRLSEMGYSTFSATYSADGKYQTMVANVKNHVNRRNVSSLLFTTSEDGVKALSSLITYFRRNDCDISEVSVLQ